MKSPPLHITSTNTNPPHCLVAWQLGVGRLAPKLIPSRQSTNTINLWTKSSHIPSRELTNKINLWTKSSHSIAGHDEATSINNNFKLILQKKLMTPIQFTKICTSDLQFWCCLKHSTNVLQYKYISMIIYVIKMKVPILKHGYKYDNSHHISP